MLPGADRWVDGGGDSKSSVLVFYRLCKLMEALQQDVDNPKPAKASKGR